MAITVDWPSRVIHVQQVDFPLDVEVLQDALRVLEQSDEGMLHPATHEADRSPAILGATLTVELINNYTMLPEAGAYEAAFTGGNFVGTIDYSPGVQVVRPLSVAFSPVSGLTAQEAEQLSYILRLLRADEHYSGTKAIKRDEDTGEVLLDKDVTGGTAPVTPIDIVKA